MIDAGADAVIGGHPHVTQEVDIYLGKPIIYSVGNFEVDPEFRTAV
jgi:poly-gamma-glutamate synthesis protein (capsule biosynthesis protein)